ncbi:ECF-type sigma factor [Opitutales bacterium ASA1]|nr:ECF-type sigma factor [Opitutales bacterium ASA1]
MDRGLRDGDWIDASDGGRFYSVPVECPSGIAGLVDRAQGGDPKAVEALFAAAYEELRTLARARLRSGGRDVVLDTTALVHESYLRLAGVDASRLQDGVHFLRYASRAMRSVIVDFVRARQAQRRGGGAEHVPLTTQLGDHGQVDEDAVLKVHEALEELAGLDARLAQVVEMRYFAGLSEIEIAQSLGVTERTVRRDWAKARALLSKAID